MTTIQQLHERLQTLFPGKRVLLSGSTFRGERMEGSDVDFQILSLSAREWFFWRRLWWNKLTALKQEFPFDWNTTLVPRLFLWFHAWYVEGVDQDGRHVRSKIAVPIMRRNALLRARQYLSSEPRMLRKVAGQIVVYYLGAPEFSHKKLAAEAAVVPASDEERRVVVSCLMGTVHDADAAMKTLRGILVRMPSARGMIIGPPGI